MKRAPRGVEFSPVRLVLAYALGAVLWIGVVNPLISGAASQVDLPDLAFVAATSVVLFALLGRRARTLARVETERDRLVAVVEQASESIVLTDVVGTIEYVNPAFERVTGYARDEVIGQNLRILKSGVQTDAFYHDLWTTLGQGRAWSGLFVNRRKDGTLFEEEEVISPIRDAAGLVTHYAATKRDVTTERQLESTLERNASEREAIQRNLAEAQRIAHIGSWERDIATGALHWSDESHRILGVEPGTFAGTVEAFLRFVHPDDRSKATSSLADLAAGDSRTTQYRIVRPDGAVRLLHEEAVVVRDTTGAPVRYVGSTQDITERVAVEKERTRLEEGLRRSERNLAEAQRVAHIGSWEWDLVTGLAQRSDELHRIFGVEPGTIPGTTDAFLACVHPDDQARVEASERAAISDGGQHALDYRVVRPDGTVRLVHEQGETIRDASGHPVQMVGTVQDITERVQFEARQTRLARLLDELSSEIYVFDADTLRFTEANAGALRNVGYSLDELCELTPLDLKPEHTQASFAELLAPLRTGTRDQVTFETTHRRKDGSTYPVEVRVHLLATETPRAFVAIIQDITERVAAEEERTRLVSAVEQTGDSIWIEHLDGTIAYANPSFARLYGYEPDEIVGRYAGVMDSGRHEPAFFAEIRASVASGKTWTGSIVNRRKDGTSVEVEAVISAIRDASGQVVSYLQTDRDVTRERTLEAQLRQSQKMEAVGQLAGGIAHDFNNLLTAIRGYGELVRRGLPVDDEGNRADIDEVIANADRAAELTRQLLAFSRRQVLQPRVVDPAAIVEGIAPLLRRLLGEQVELTAATRRDACCVKADSAQLEQVIINLAVNARDAMSGGGRLTIETAPVELGAEFARTHPEVTPGSFVALTVSDTGSGIDPEIQARIFEPFFTTKPAGEGTGLGLATVYGIVKQSGGFIYVESEPGRGATFTIYLPRVIEEPAATVAQTTAASPSLSGTETVLLVDDEPTVRDFAARVLADHGYTVLKAPDAETAFALALAHPGPIELLVTDVIMPRVSGPELAERLVAERPGIRVLYISGYAENRLGHSLTLSAEMVYLPKPFTTEALAQAVHDTLGTGRRLDPPGPGG